MSDGAAMRKARLLSEGRFRLDWGVRLPFYATRGCSGPMSGGRSVFLEVEGNLVKMELTKDPGCPTVLRRRGGKWLLSLPLEAGPLEVRPVKARFHAPGMAFFHLGEGCRYDCAFCTVPEELGYGGSERSAEDWLRLVTDALEEDPSSAVAFTSGVAPGQSEMDEVRAMADVVGRVHKKFPDTPVGVEPYVTGEEGVRLLHAAGADEIKINVETATDRLFTALCPSLDREGLWRAIGAAADIFGRGKVCSNVLVGIGESRVETLETVGRLASMGCVATLRTLRVNDLNRDRLAKALGRTPPGPDADELLELAREHGRVLREHGLSPRGFQTMCHRCTACDLVPDRDVPGR